MQWIGVIDCNNFFVSCERLFRPDLRTRPVLVLSSNDGCVVARSQEVKDIGIPMGVPYFKVKDIIKDNGITVFSSHFALYRDVSRRVFSVVKAQLDTVELYSIDEAFFTIEGPEHEIIKTLTRLKNTIEREVGVPVSIGVGPNKTIAKWVVDRAKKTGGLSVFSKTEWEKCTGTIAPGELWGVGPQLSRRMRESAIDSVATFVVRTPAWVERHFGVHGLRLQAEIAGMVAYPVETTATTKQSVTSSRSFRTTTTDKRILSDAVAYHTRHVAANLRAMNRKTDVIRLAIRPSRHSDFVLRGKVGEQKLAHPTNDTFTLLAATQHLLETLYEHDVPYRKVGVTVPAIYANELVQTALFETTTTPNRVALMAVIDGLNTRAGKEIVLIGERKQGSVWQAKRDAQSPAYTTKWTDVAEVKTG